MTHGNLPSLLPLAMLAGCWLLSPCQGSAQSLHWKTGGEFDKALASPLGITWQDRPLREGLMRLAEETGVCLLLDRRVDPGRPVSVTVTSAPLETLLEQVAAAVGDDTSRAGTSRVGPVVYFGPAATAVELATIAELRRREIAALPSAQQAALLRSRPWQWEQLAEPRQLVESLAAEAGLRIDNLSALPHDLWPACSLPSLTWADRLTLVLAGFGLTYELKSSDAAIALVPITPGAVVEKRYTPRGSADNLAPQLRRRLPHMQIKENAGQIVASGRAEDHAKIERLLSGQSIRSAQSVPTAGEKLFTLRVTAQPAGAVVKQVAQALGKQLTYDSNLLEKLQQPVTLDLKDATPEHLLDTTLGPLGLTFRLTDRELIVTSRNR